MELTRYKAYPCCGMYQYFIPFYRQILFHYMDISHFSYPSADGPLVVSTFCLLWIMMLWTLVYKCLCGPMFSVLLGVHLGVNCWHGAIPCLTLGGTAELFFKSFYFPTSSVRRFQFLHLLTNTYYVFFITDTLVHTKWYFIVVLIFTFLMVNDDMTF